MDDIEKAMKLAYGPEYEEDALSFGWDRSTDPSDTRVRAER